MSIVCVCLYLSACMVDLCKYYLKWVVSSVAVPYNFHVQKSLFKEKTQLAASVLSLVHAQMQFVWLIWMINRWMESKISGWVSKCREKKKFRVGIAVERMLI